MSIQMAGCQRFTDTASERRPAVLSEVEKFLPAEKARELVNRLDHKGFLALYSPMVLDVQTRGGRRMEMLDDFGVIAEDELLGRWDWLKDFRFEDTRIKCVYSSRAWWVHRPADLLERK